jgi:hypothetical protein
MMAQPTNDRSITIESPDPSRGTGIKKGRLEAADPLQSLVDAACSAEARTDSSGLNPLKIRLKKACTYDSSGGGATTSIRRGHEVPPGLMTLPNGVELAPMASINGSIRAQHAPVDWYPNAQWSTTPEAPFNVAKPSSHEDLFAALVITRPSVTVYQSSAFRTYTLNPTMVEEWLGRDPIGRLRESLAPRNAWQQGNAPHKSLFGVSEFSIRNLHCKAALDKSIKGTSALFWKESSSGTEFSATTTTWI